jgi:hypothetical protein
MQTLSGNGKLLAAARHNKREIQKELGAAGHIDATKMHLNYALLGDATPEAVAAKAKSILQSLGITKLRKNAVSAIEIVFSLPVHAQIDHRAYFADCRDERGCAPRRSRPTLPHIAVATARRAYAW